MRSSSAELVPLTAARGIAAAIVVLYHASMMVDDFVDRGALPEAFRLGFVPLISSGYLAVDFFFVLSGFVITKANLHVFVYSFKINTIAFFVMKRIGRIFFVNLAVLMFLVLKEFSKYHVQGDIAPFTGPNTPGKWIESALLVQTWVFGSGPTWNLVAWSLSVEWAAYLLFPVILLVLLRTFWPTMVFTALAAIGGLAWLQASNPADTLHLTDHGAVVRGLCSFTLGMIVELASRRHGLPQRIGSWFGSGWNIAAATIAMATLIVVGGHDWVTIPIFCYLVLALSLASRGATAVLSISPLHLLGIWSFSLYLTHYTVLKLYTQLALRLFPDGKSPALVLGGMAAALIACVVVAALTHRLIEAPGYKLTLRWADALRRSRLSVAA